MVTTEKALTKGLLSKKALLFSLSYLIYLFIFAIQRQAGEFVLQGSGDLDSVTSYDYVLPMINSAATVAVHGIFLVAGYFAYNKDKVKMLRFPMAFCFSVAMGSLFSDIYSSLTAVPLFQFLSDHSSVIDYISVGIVTVAVVILFLYFNSEKESNDYYSEYYVDNPKAYKSLRNKILSNRLSIFWIALIVCEGSGLIGGILRSGFTAAVVFVPDGYIWLGSCIDAVSDTVTYVLYLVLAWYFIRNRKTALKFVGLIFFINQSMNAFSFILNSITNVFAQAGDNLINSVFSTIFVGIAASAISVIRFIVLFIVCLSLKKVKED